MTEVVINLVFTVSKGQLHLANQKRVARLKVDENIPGALVQLVLNSDYFKLLATDQRLVDPLDILLASYAPAPQDVEHVECNQVDTLFKHVPVVQFTHLVEILNDAI